MDFSCCHHCKSPLTGRNYVLKDGQPICLKCYEQYFANRCESCKKTIGTKDRDAYWGGKHWHDQCFRCNGCNTILGSNAFIPNEEKLYCSDCYDANFAQRCDICTNTFKHGMQKFEYDGKRYHSQCFSCTLCKQQIGNGSFVPREGDQFMCMTCYNEHFAQKCGKCGDVLLQGGVTFRESAFHKECFVCTKCSAELAHTKFATKNNDPYCSDCYIRLYAKSCEECKRPIAGIGNAVKYVKLGNKYWHSPCFNCQDCGRLVVKDGFLTVGNMVMCPDCARLR